MPGITKESHFSAALTLFFSKLSTAKPAWYSVKVFSKDAPSLPSLLGMNYETMLMVFHFAGFAGPGGKSFSADKFNTFISLNNLDSVLECTHYATKGCKGYHICIGNRELTMTNTPGKPTAKSLRITNIKRLRQELTDSLKKETGRQLLKRGEGARMQELLQSFTAADENKEEETELDLEPDDPFDDLLHIRIRSHLLPLLIHEDKLSSITDLWNPNHTVTFSGVYSIPCRKGT